MKKFIIITAVSFLAVGLLVFWSLNQDKKLGQYKATDNTEKLGLIGQVFENQGQTHIKRGESHTIYNSNTPTSGWHWLDPASWGVYNRPLVDEQAVHNLEHGG